MILPAQALAAPPSNAFFWAWISIRLTSYRAVNSAPVSSHAGHQPGQLLLPIQGSTLERLGLDQADRLKMLNRALRRIALNAGLALEAGPPSEPETGPAADADHGTLRHLPAAPD